jgi:hypothetical protein
MNHSLQTAKSILTAQRDTILRLPVREYRAPEPYLIDYIKTVVDLQSEIRADLSAFLIPSEAIERRVEGIQEFDTEGNLISDNPISRGCDKEYLLGKITALLAYIENNDVELASDRLS